jgi:hypothetical protein
MLDHLPATARAEICDVLSWIAEHPDALWADMGERKAVYDRWRDVIWGNLPLLRDTGTMHTVHDLSSFGQLFLMECKAEGEASKPRKRRGRKPDPTIDPKKDKRIAEAWETEHYSKYADLARELGISEREVRLAIDRHQKREKRKRR